MESNYSSRLVAYPMQFPTFKRDKVVDIKELQFINMVKQRWYIMCQCGQQMTHGALCYVTRR